MRFKYTNRLGLTTGDMNMARMITGQHGEEYKEERVVIEEQYAYYASITLPEVTTERGGQCATSQSTFQNQNPRQLRWQGRCKIQRSQGAIQRGR